MNKFGIVGIVVLIVTLTACPVEPPPPSSPPTPPTPPATTITPSGGTLTFQSGQVTMQFPAGAVAADTTIGVTPVTTPPADGIPGTVYQFSPDGIQFAKPVRLTVKYDPAQIPKGTLETQLELAKVKTDGWQSLTTTIDQTAQTVSADLNGFSSYGAIPTVKAWTFGSNVGDGTRVNSIAADTVGNVYLVGTSDEYGGPVTQNNRAFITSFTRDGVPRSGWPVRLSLPTGYTVWTLSAVAVDTSSGFVCVTGSGNTATAGGFAQGTICYTPDGKVRSGWPVFVTTNLDYGGGIVVDPTANVYISGTNASKAFVTSYNSSGALRTGWPRTFGAGKLTLGGAIALDTSANVFLAWNSVPVPNSGTVVESLTSDGLTRSGFPVSVQGTNGNNNSGSLLAEDMTGNTFVAWTDFLSGKKTITSLNPSGAVRAGWPNPLQATPPASIDDNSALRGIAVNVLGDVYAVASLDPRTSSATNSADVWLTSFNSSGAIRSGYPKILGSEFSDEPASIAVNMIGDVFIAGRTNGDFQGLSIGTSGGSPLGFVARVRGY
jgi:hypothetical protein